MRGRCKLECGNGVSKSVSRKGEREGKCEGKSVAKTVRDEEKVAAQETRGLWLQEGGMQRGTR